MAAGGPLLHPSLGGIVLVPIAPHALSNRPIVLPDSEEIRIEIVAGRDASANFDMQSLAQLHHGDRIKVRRAACQTRFLHPPGWSYYATLRRKLAEIGDVRLLIVDPIVSAVMGDSHKNAEVRRSLQPLVDLAAFMRCAIRPSSLATKSFIKGLPNVERRPCSAQDECDWL